MGMYLRQFPRFNLNNLRLYAILAIPYYVQSVGEMKATFRSEDLFSKLQSFSICVVLRIPFGVASR